MNSDEIKETRGIGVNMIIEVIGRPPEHLVETMENIVGQIGEEKGVRIIEKKIHEPVLMKDQKDFFSAFVDVEFEAEEIIDIAMIMFKYMPAHIEINNPELIVLTNNGWSDILNQLTRALHGYDEIARVMQTEKAILEKKSKDSMPKKD